MQLPFFRIIPTGGNTWVAIFFILSGFVCSRNALRLARAQQADEARKNISRSMIRRVVRLIVPATAATFVCWASTQAGLYEFARAGDRWVSAGIAPKVEGVVNAVKALLKECVSSPFFLFLNLMVVAMYLARRHKLLRSPSMDDGAGIMGFDEGISHLDGNNGIYTPFSSGNLVGSHGPDVLGSRLDIVWD
jgi:Acyltransferase family